MAHHRARKGEKAHQAGGDASCGVKTSWLKNGVPEGLEIQRVTVEELLGILSTYGDDNQLIGVRESTTAADGNGPGNNSKVERGSHSPLYLLTQVDPSSEGHDHLQIHTVG